MKKLPLIFLTSMGILFAKVAFAIDFSLVPPETDLSYQYLSMMFGVVGGVLHGTGSQILGAMFGMFNSGVLALGGIIITYTLFVSTLNTAAEGEVMGRKWSSIWIPLRTAAGTAMLLPKSTGYCAIQVMVMWVAVQGIGCADSVWNVALDYLSKGGAIIQQNEPGTQAMQVMGFMESLGTLYQNEVCLAAVQNRLQYLFQNHVPGFTTPPPDLINLTMQQFDTVYTSAAQHPSSTALKVNFPPGLTNTGMVDAYTSVCGGMSFTFDPDDTYFSESNFLAAKQIFLDMATVAEQTVADWNFSTNSFTRPLGSCEIDPSGQVTNCGDIFENNTWQGDFGQAPVLSPYTFQNAQADFKGILGAAVRNKFGHIQNLSQDIVKQNQRDGWLLAGAYYWDLAQAGTANNAFQIYSGDVSQYFKVQDYTSPSNLHLLPNPLYDPILIPFLSPMPKEITNYVQSAKAFQTSAGTGGALPNQTIIGLISTAVAVEAAAIILMGLAAPPLGILFLFMLPGIGELLGGFFTLVNSQANDYNPIFGIALMGSGMMDFSGLTFIGGAVSAFLATLFLSFAPFVALGTSGAALWAFIAPFMTAFLGTVFVTGATMTYYIPLVPYILFTFGGLGWFITVLEAMVAAPLVAIGIAYPEEHDVLGRAGPSVLLLANVFLRPTLMLFGYVGGIMLSYISIWILNRGFLYALTAIVNTTGIFKFLFMPFAVIVIYASICVILVTKAFSLIHVVPDRVFRWLGGNIEGHIEAQAAQEMRQSVGEGMHAMGAGITPKAGGEAGKEEYKKGYGDQAQAEKGKREEDKKGSATQQQPISNKAPPTSGSGIGGTGGSAAAGG